MRREKPVDAVRASRKTLTYVRGSDSGCAVETVPRALASGGIRQDVTILLTTRSKRHSDYGIG
jgi:hypothetical protein